MDGMNYSLSDIKSVLDGTGTQSGGLGGGMGVWLILLLLFLGRGGNLLGGSPLAAEASVAGHSGLDFETFEKVEDGIVQGLNNTSAINANIVANAAATQNAISHDTEETQEAIAEVRAALAQCCCEQKLALATQTANITAQITAVENGFQSSIASQNAFLATQFCQINTDALMNKRDIIDEIEDGKDEILKFLTQSELDELVAENNDLKFQISQGSQSAAIIAAIQAGVAAGLAGAGIPPAV